MTDRFFSIHTCIPLLLKKLGKLLKNSTFLKKYSNVLKNHVNEYFYFTANYKKIIIRSCISKRLRFDFRISQLIAADF